VPIKLPNALVFLIWLHVATRDAIAGLGQLGGRRLDSHSAGYHDSSKELFDFDRFIRGHMDNLVLGRWRHMDAGAGIRH
jgi:hypothetical protein